MNMTYKKLFFLSLKEKRKLYFFLQNMLLNFVNYKIGGVKLFILEISKLYKIKAFSEFFFFNLDCYGLTMFSFQKMYG